MLFSFLVSFLINLGVIVFSKKTGFFIDEVSPDKPQKFHTIPVPRAGGIGIFLSFVIFSFYFLGKGFLPVFISSLPVFFIGLFEDLKGNISPKIRMLFMAFGSVIAIVLSDAVIRSVGFFDLPFWVAVPFTVFAVVGLTNAINMIDGFNGLASGITLISLAFFCAVSYQLGDMQTFNCSVLLFFSVLGFFVLNFPLGKIFLGDGGAYFLGFFLAILSIQIVNKNSEVSPWFPVVLLAYPIFDVLFAIFRRKFLQGRSPFSPDKLHLHSLIYKKMTKNNPLTAVVIVLFTLPFSIAGYLNYSDTNVLFGIFVLFCISYLGFYYILSRQLIKRILRG